MIVVAACIVTPAEAIAQTQWVYFGPLVWEVELEFDGLREQRDGIDATLHQRYTEKLELRKSGFILDPRIVNFSVALTPTLVQGLIDGRERGERTDGSFLDYNVRVGALQGTASRFNVEAAAFRNTGTFSSNLGSRTEYTLENRSVNLVAKLPLMPMVFGYGEILREQSFKSGLASTIVDRDEFERSVRWQAGSSKMQIVAEKRWFDDRIGENDFDMTEQRLLHTLRWGKNSHLTTQQSYFSREGISSFNRLLVSERLRLQHLENLFSLVNYDYFSTEQEEDSETHVGEYALKYQVNDHFKANIVVNGRNEDFSAGSEMKAGGRLELDYRRKIFANGRLGIDLAIAGLRTDRESNGSTFETLDDSYTVPASLIVLLDARAIDVNSIAVTDSAGTQIFFEGVDYVVRSLSGDRTELQILTTGQIAAGDVILVSYSAAAQPSAEFDSESIDAGISLHFDRIRFYHQSRVNELTLRSGSFGGAEDGQRSHTTGVEVNWSRGRFEATGRGETHSYESGDFSTKSDSLTETAQIRITPDAHLNLSAGQISSESDGRESDLSQWDLKLKWVPARGLVVQPFLSSWDRQEEAGQFEKRLSAGVNLTWQLRQFALDFDISHLNYETDGSDGTEQRAGIRIVRKSR